MFEHTYEWIKRQVDDIAEERSVQVDRAFEAWCLCFVHQDLDLDDAFIATSTLKGSGGGDGGLDGWYKDESSHEFHIWQCKWSHASVKQFDKTPALELKNALEELLVIENATFYGSSFTKASAELNACLEHDYRIVLNIGIAGSMSDSARQQFDKSVNTFSRDRSLKISWELWDLEKFQQEYEERHPSAETLEGKSFKFQLQSSEVIQMSGIDETLPNGWEAAVVTLNAKSLGEVANQLGSKLFSLNVRFALGSNPRIKSIRETLVDDEFSRYFWLYNNGLTILCSNFSIDGTKKTINIENPQVVNGCQTVTAFKYQLGKYSIYPSVLARIIKAPDDDLGQQQAALIAEKTNSQNPVLSRDLRSNDPVQKALRAAFEQLDPPWFYERKRGEWSAFKSDKGNFKKFENRRLDMEYVGQAWRMLNGEPAAALTRKRELFEDDKIYQSVFQTQRSPEQFLFAARLRMAYDEFWHGKNFDGIRSTCGSYLSDDTLRRFMRAKGQVVSHSVALTCQLLKDGRSNFNLHDAKSGLTLVDDFNNKLRRWNIVLAKAFHERLEAIDQDEESPGFKKYLEQPNSEASKALWRSIEATGSTILLTNGTVSSLKCWVLTS